MTAPYLAIANSDLHRFQTLADAKRALEQDHLGDDAAGIMEFQSGGYRLICEGARDSGHVSWTEIS